MNVSAAGEARERDNLLRIIGALARVCYGAKLGTNAMATEMHDDLLRFKVDLCIETLRRKLVEANYILDRPTP